MNEEQMKKRTKDFVFSCSLFLMVILTGIPLNSWGEVQSSESLVVYTVNYPLKYFAERIAGEHATVILPAPADGDPAYWMPDTKTISDYQQADLILLNGVNYAQWVRKVSLPRSKMVNTSAKFKDRYITAKKVVTHTHGAKGAHAHESLAFTTWIDFDLASQQAGAIATAFSRKRPELRDVFQKNYMQLEKDLKRLDQKIKEIVSKNNSQPLIASHPVYDYFMRRYGLDLQSVHWEPDEIPGSEQWMELQNILKDHPAKWMIWEARPAIETIEKLKSVGINSLVFDPCGNVPGKGDFMSIMRRNISSLQMAF